MWSLLISSVVFHSIFVSVHFICITFEFLIWFNFIFFNFRLLVSNEYYRMYFKVFYFKPKTDRKINKLTNVKKRVYNRSTLRSSTYKWTKKHISGIFNVYPLFDEKIRRENQSKIEDKEKNQYQIDMLNIDSISKQSKNCTIK